MGTLLISFKRIVTALCVATLSVPAATAQIAALDPLFEDLLAADDITHTRVATEILRELE